MPTRAEMWDRLGGEFDLLVVGGGIVGCGIARDAALRGLRVALLEAKDFAYGTSSRSSKLVHGGLRYLEHYEFGLVFEAVSERRVLLDIAPHLVHPLGFLFPVFKSSRQSLLMLSAGMWLYDGLSLFRSPKLHKRLDPRAATALEPALRSSDLKGAPLYYDCATDDARLTLENALDAARVGAAVVNQARVISFLKDEAGRLAGAVVEDGETGTLREVRASVVVNASGPWTDRVLAMNRPAHRATLRPTKGVHIVVPSERLPVQHAVVILHPDDGRVLFAIPWGDRTYIGTTDTDYEGDPGQVHATTEDVTYLLGASNDYFPNQKLVPDDVIATWAGLRPLIAPAGDGVDEGATSREHAVMVSPEGLITISGGKLTTYRRMAAEVVDNAVNLLRLLGKLPNRLGNAHTDREPLPGAVGWPEDDDPARLVEQVVGIAAGGLSDASARSLVGTYGTRALDVARIVAADPALGAPLVDGRPEVLAQVDLAVREEMANQVSDVLIRRTQVYYREVDQGLGCADAVAARMGALLGWDEERVQASADAYRADVALARTWKQPTA